ncbi:hypothetical protein [Desulfovulcanus sp.]
MNELCFFSNLTSAELAAWVQAVGSVLAIVAATWIAKHQANLQHQNALDLHKTEKRTEQTDIIKTLSVLAINSSKAMKHITSQLTDRESVHNAAEGLVPCDVGELIRIDTYLSDIPLHTVPHSMVTLTMILGSTVRQFKEKVEMALTLHRKMDAEMFEYFFRTISEMNISIEATCNDINTEVKRLETSV